MNALNDQLSIVLVNVATGLITLLGAYAMIYINKLIAQAKAETAQIENEEQRGLMIDALSRLDDCAEKTVNKIEQVTAKVLREAIKTDGKDKEALIELGKLAKLEVEKTLEPVYLDFLKTTLGDFDTYIENVIEAKVVKVKGAS